MNKNSISIITCTYNSGKTLERTLDSLQFDCNVLTEHIFVDGYSSDRTLEIISGYKQRRGNVKLIKLNPKGVYNALNCGIDVATGEWTFFLHSDDELVPSLTKIREILNNIPTVVACFSVQIESGLSVRKYSTNSFCRNWMPPPHTGMIFRTSFLKRVKFDENYKISGDFKQILTIKAIDMNAFTPVYEDLTIMKAGGLSTSPRNFLKSLREDYQVLSDLNIPFAFLKAVAKKMFKLTQVRGR